jgi:hypothetical protein
MRQTEAERLLYVILQLQMDIESMRRRLQVASTDNPADEDLKLAVSLIARAGDNLVPIAREMRKPVTLTMGERFRRMIEHG